MLISSNTVMNIALTDFFPDKKTSRANDTLKQLLLAGLMSS